MSDPKYKKNSANKEKMSDDTSKYIERFFGDVSKTSATKQIAIGAVSGWTTGFLTMKVGKMAAIAVGGGIILLQIANQQGYITIDWNKIHKKVDKVTDRVEEAVTGEGPKWMDKAERFVDRKINQAEDLLKKNQNKAKKWYHTFTGDEKGPCINEFHIFVCAFVGGVAIGLNSA